jgi:uncharacterized membrane protein YGL010W
MDRWLKQYAGDHRHPTNHRIHQVFIPLILLSTVGFLQLIPGHRALFGVPLGWGDAALMVLLAFYSLHDTKLAFAAVPGAILIALLVRLLPWPALVALFVVGWTAQLIGHAKYEGNKPTLTDNLVALLVAPAFLLDELLR